MAKGILGRPSERAGPNFEVELWVVKKRMLSWNISELIRSCPHADSHEIFSPGLVVARLSYSQWVDALEAMIALWESRLDGAHYFSPRFKTRVVVPSDQNELTDRLRTLFAVHVQCLLRGEALERCKQKLETIDMELRNVVSLLKSSNPLKSYYEINGKKEGLISERRLVEKRIEEFKSAMVCIHNQLDLAIWDDCLSYDSEDDGVVPYKFKGTWNWDRLHHILLRECRRLDDGLPIYGCRQEILKKVLHHQVLVLVGETGSGKSTQLVQFLADSGLAEGLIICTQPRKISAASLAQRVGEECLGCYADNSIVSHTAYSCMQRLNSKVIFMTDHCLLQYCLYNSDLSNVSYIIVDEAHERSLNTDLLLALIKGLLLRRQDLRLIIMSATADEDKLSNYFFRCDTYHVMGRSFGVDIKYVTYLSSEPSEAKDGPLIGPYVKDVIKMVREIHVREDDGAILAFLTSQLEVEWACEKFQVPNAVALPLHGKLSSEEQCHVFQSYSGKRKVIFATNFAETSLTIPGVKYVVDSGLVKECRYEASTGMNMLKVCRISQSSANQRSGRAGRTEPGKCYRLYSVEEFASMPCHPEPEILRVHLGVAVLKILAIGVKNIQSFDFIDAPNPKAIEKAIQNLIQLGAVIFRGDVLELTDCGHQLVKLGIEPRLGKLILGCFSESLGREGLVLAAVMANANSIFCRVGNDEEKTKSDCLKVKFCHRDGDLFTLLSVYKEWENEPANDRNRWCWENSINAKSMRRCKDMIFDLEHCLQHDLNIIVPSYWLWFPHIASVLDQKLRRIILSALADNVAMFSGCNRIGYEIASTGKHAQLHPACSFLVYGHKPSWVVFGELLSTTKDYLACVTTIDFEFLDTIRPSILFDVSQLSSKRMENKVISGVGSSLLKRFCGKYNHSLLGLVSRLRETFSDEHVNINVDFDTREIHIFAPEVQIEKAYEIVNEALGYETKWIKDECLEKCLHYGAQGSFPSSALFGSGAEIKHLELEKRFLTVEISHENTQTLDDKELLLMFDKCASGIGSFHKYSGVGRERVNLEKWGTITLLSPEAAEKVVVNLNDTKIEGSLLKVTPLRTALGSDPKVHSFPAVRAKVSWPRRQSKGVAIIRFEPHEVERFIHECPYLLIDGKLVNCFLSRKNIDSAVVSGLDSNVMEPDIWDALRNATKRNILDVFLLRGEAVDHPPSAACAEALIREFANFIPRDKLRVHVYRSDPKDYIVRALIIFDGRLHLKAAIALDHIQDSVLKGCLPWQKIYCQRMFHSSVSCSPPVYKVIKKQLDSLFQKLKREKDVSLDLEQTGHGSMRVRISSPAVRTVAQCRWSIESLIKGKTITHPGLNASSMQLLLTREGINLMKSVERETCTCILFDRHNLIVRVFGTSDGVVQAEEKLMNSLLALYEDKQLEIFLRGSHLPHGLMKEVVQRFGPDLHGLKDRLSKGDLRLDPRRQVISLSGVQKESKQEVEEIILKISKELSDGSMEMGTSSSEASCPICLSNIEDKYVLEGCGHGFCRACLIEQCDSATRSHEGFPMRCAREGCGSFILLADLRNVLAHEQLEELFRASIGAFVGASGGAYRFCPTPDCPNVYKVSGIGVPADLFVCGACSVEVCTKCHLEYHPYLSCEKYKEFKDDPDSSLDEWRRGKDDVKRCSVCGFTIEKTEGCNHVECKCGNHMCWVCLESFKSSDNAYAHLRNVHGSLV